MQTLSSRPNAWRGEIIQSFQDFLLIPFKNLFPDQLSLNDRAFALPSLEPVGITLWEGITDLDAPGLGLAEQVTAPC